MITTRIITYLQNTMNVNLARFDYSLHMHARHDAPFDVGQMSQFLVSDKFDALWSAVEMLLQASVQDTCSLG